jgi:hypothetical protein
MVIDDFFLPRVAELTGSLQADFACPTAAAEVAPGEWMSFEQGTMVAIAGSPLTFVYYADGSWEQVARDAALAPSEGVEEGSSEIAALPPPFAAIYAAKGRHILLGRPLQETALQTETLMQPFMGGVALGSRSDGRILLLERASLRF